ncbi:MAG: MFS transporter [Gammaproteobacteria bacterium]|nr:MFS transporter [Gammaproteobacteria bacterium]
MISVAMIVGGQIIYTRFNADSFQESYLQSLQAKTRKLGEFIKSDVEYVLNLRIPLTKLIKVEGTLKEILLATPELEFIEITDLDGYVLYYADHQSMGRVEPGIKLSRTSDNAANRKLESFGLTPAATDTVLPILNPRKKRLIGYIKMRLSPHPIISTSREILLDMITVILTSLLVTFEFLMFFVAYSISDPLRCALKDIRHAIRNFSLLPAKTFLFMKELGNVMESFNRFMTGFQKKTGSFVSVQQRLPEAQKQLAAGFRKQTKIPLSEQAPGNPALQSATGRLQTALIVLQQRTEFFFNRVSAQALPLAPSDLPEEKENEDIPADNIPYPYIRPLIFIFLIAHGLSASFFPLYVETFYVPLPGLSKEMVLGLPISLFMLFFAFSMLFTGRWTDLSGWYTPLLAGLFINAAGFILTGLSQNITEVFVFRSLTAIGFGIAFMACQRFIMGSTTSQTRAPGMAAMVAAFMGGDLVGTVIGGMLADRIGYDNVFFMAGVFSLLAFVFALLLFRKNTGRSLKRVKKAGKLIPVKELFRAAGNREFFAMVFLQAIPAKMALIGFLFYFVPIYLKGLGTLQSDIGRVIMCYSLALIILGPLLSKLFHNPAFRKYYVFTGGFITGIAMLGFHFHSGFFAVLLLVTALGIAHTFSMSAQASFISETAIVKQLGAGTGIGVFRFWERTGNVIGPLVMGALMTSAGYQQSVVWLGMIILACSFLYLIMMLWPRIKNIIHG